MTNTTKSVYARFRAAGMTPSHALNSAKTLIEWQVAESAGLVKVYAEPEQERYFDVWGEPEGYEGANGKHVSAEQERKELLESFERDGVWCVVSEYFADGEWHMAESVGMCTGYRRPDSPFDNWCVPDLMRSALACVGQPGEH